jgi:hypothetical protein
MSNPKFSVGDLVAVCTTPLNIVIPKTRVIEVSFAHQFISINMGGKVGVNVWSYKVADHSDWFAEWTLRPHQPGDYTESTLESHKPIEAEA